jgi:hypothetical protein
MYLETTMFSFYYEERTAQPYPELKAEVRRIFELIKAGAFEAYTSPYAIREINNEPNQEKREKMQALSAACGAAMLPITKEAERLAGRPGRGGFPCMGNRRGSYCGNHGQWIRFYSEPEFHPHSQALDY